MPISVTCQCGARLEIDEKFLGKEIPCPDCNRPLPTTPPAKPPPLELPDNRRVSGLAALSLTLAIVGPPILGTLAAVAVGFFALREIARRPAKFEGANLARAAIITGTVMTFLWLVMLISPTALGLDVFLREFKYASRRSFPRNKTIESIGNDITIAQPNERWARFESQNQNPSVLTDDLIILNTTDDAYIACQSAFIGGNDDKKTKALERVKSSELIFMLNGGPLDREWTIVEPKDPPPNHAEEVILDVRLGRKDCRILIQFSSPDRIKLDIMVACAPRSRFDQLEPNFRSTFKSKK